MTERRFARVGLGIGSVALVAACALAVGCESRDATRTAWTTASAIAAHDEALAKGLASEPFAEDGRGGVVAHAWITTTKTQGLTLGAHLPSDARGAFDVGLATADETHEATQGEFVLRLTHAGVSDAKLLNDAGHVTYRDVAPATDLLVRASDTQVEWFYLLHDASAPSAFTMHVDLPKGIPSAIVRCDGSIAFLDARARTRLAMPAPYAIDARGTRHAATLAWDAVRHVIDVRVDTAGVEFPLLVDPTVERPYWQPVDPPSWGTVAYDSKRQRTVLLEVGTVAGTWEWDGTQWSEVSSTSPGYYNGNGLAYDAAVGRTVTIAEDTQFTFDTWAWDGIAWTSLGAVPSGLSARDDMSLVYDSVRQKVVLFGGDDNDSCDSNCDPSTYADTWEWDGTTWTQRATSGPPATASAPLAFDSARGKTVLFAGTGTWEWDGTTWTQVATTGPSARTGAAMAFDSTRGKTLLYGGYDATNPNTVLTDTWQWDGTTWAQVASTALDGSGLLGGADMAFDSARGKAVLVGGAGTWEWDGTTWTQRVGLPVPISAGGRTASFYQGMAMAYDAARAKVLLFGGSDDGQDQFLLGFWQWNGSWSPQPASALPPGRSSASMVYESARQKTLLFGGVVLDLMGNYSFLSDTWEWDGTSWTSLSPSSSPHARYGAALTYDTARSKAVLFGGAYSGATYGSSVTALNDTWEWDGTSWLPISVSSAPAARYNAGVAYDAARAKTVLFGGTGGSTYNDTWEWDGTSWVAPSVTHPPSAGGEGIAMAYDSARAKTVLFGHGSFGQNTWEWDGTSWTLLNVAVVPAAYAGPMVYDSASAQMVLLDLNTNNPLTWFYYVVGDACTTNATCASGTCVDGVCCNRPQCGPCQACNLANSAGLCTNVSAGTVPTTGDANACQAPNTCTASGTCVEPLGAACTENADCLSALCVDGVCCNVACTDDCQACSIARGAETDGTCVTAAESSPGKGNCGIYACSGATTSCTTSCNNDLGCAPGYYCDTHGTCVPQLAPGAACNATAGGDCLLNGCRDCAPTGDAGSGQCVDGVCCDTPCEGACESCNGATPGTCTNDAKGTAGSPTCAPFLCGGDSSSCATSCSADSDCASLAFCNPVSHQCIGTAPTGTPCASDNACMKGACVEGVCCDKHCGMSSDGGAPLCQIGVCTAATGYTCQLPSGVQCRDETCAGALHTFSAVCDGTGGCGDLETQDCTPYQCDTKKCKTMCTSDSDCTTGATCDVGTNKCVAGATCSADGSSVVSNSGLSTPCSPYVCEANACAKTCSSVKECASGFACTTSGACVASNAAPTTNSGGCGCRVGRSSGAPAPLWLAAMIFALGRRRRHRQARL